MNLLPLLNSTNRNRLSSESSKRKCAALAQKAAPTCTLSLTSVSVSAHGSSDSLNFIPFPCTSTSISFPSEPILIPTSTSTTASSPSATNNLPPRPRVRTQASLLRRKRSSAKLLVQPDIPPCSSQVESEPDQVSSTPPRKRARKASISSPPSTLSTPSSSSSPSPSFHSLSISSHSPSQRKNGKASKKANADLRFLCSVYRSIAWLRLQREFSEATRCLINAPDSMDVDIDPPCVSALDAQEKLLMSRLRSYLIFNEMNSQWLDMTPIPPFTHSSVQEVDVSMDTDIREESKSSPAPPLIASHPQQQQQQQPPPMMNSDQVIASLMLRYRYRSKGKSRPEALPVLSGQEGTTPVKMRKRSPLAGPEASWVPAESMP